MDKKIEVSVCIFSFNYEKYIDEAILSVLNQNTQFSFEIVIGDDLSADDTRNIILKYKKLYPEIINLSFNEKNEGGTKNWIRTINACKGEYIALLDGDDYFTDTYKLQKQYDLMVSDKTCVLSFHAVEEFFGIHSLKNFVCRWERRIFKLEDFITEGWFIRTSSLMFKNGIIPETPPKWVHDFPYRYDTIMHVFLVSDGGIALYLDDTMSIWRKHEGGMSNYLYRDKFNNLQEIISLANKLDEFTKYKKHDLVKKYCAKYYSELILEIIKENLWLKKAKFIPEIIYRADWKVFYRRVKNKIFNDRIFRLG